MYMLDVIIGVWTQLVLLKCEETEFDFNIFVVVDAPNIFVPFNSLNQLQTL